ncbi:MAG TPA: hypothetical protein VGB37_03005, partial [Candidatus Lokiarchaeia archaeon]
NYGEWEIDHIKPLSKFNLLNTEEQNRACHYSNLQPMWASQNRYKFNKNFKYKHGILYEI